MINFFRKVRQRLFYENRFTKYLLYATGEITLVVVGILIALQVNNWNENRKDRVHAVKILKSLEQEIRQDSIYFDKVFHVEESVLLVASQRLFEEHSMNEVDTKYDSTLGTYFRYASFTPVIKYTDNAYKELANSNLLDQIRSEELKETLLSYYGQIDFLVKYSEEANQLSNNLGNDLAQYYTIIPPSESIKEPATQFAGAGEDKFSANYDLMGFRNDRSLNPKLYDMIDIHKDRLGAMADIIGYIKIILRKIRDEILD